MNVMPVAENAAVMPVPLPVKEQKQILDEDREKLARLFAVNVKGENKPLALGYKCRTFDTTIRSPIRSITEKLVRGKSKDEQSFIRERLDNYLSIMEEGCSSLAEKRPNIDKKFLGRTSAFLSALSTKYAGAGSSASAARRNRRTKKNRKH
jgi:hypothetical protein